MATNPTGTPPSLVERVKNIIMTPKTEWPVIDAEPSTIGSIYRNYVVILAAIPPLSLLIGLMLMGGGYIRYSMGYLVAQAVITYLMSLLGVYVLALIIEALAPSFGGRKDRLAAFKLAAYSSTAAWLAGIFGLIPFLFFLALVGLYSFYLFWIGLPVMMKSPADKNVLYVVAIIVAYIVIYMIITAITTRILWAMMPTPVSTVTFTMPG